MRHKVKYVHSVGVGGTGASNEQGPDVQGTAGSECPRAACAAHCTKDGSNR